MLKHLELRVRSLMFKLSEPELELIAKNAQKYAGGNISAWLRYAGINCKPPKSAITE